MGAYPHAFKSLAGYEAVVADYDRLLTERWTVTPQSIKIPSPQGDTHALVLGDENAPPLILLHGALNHAGIWFTIAPELSKYYRVIVPDLPGQAGKTHYKRAFHQGPAEVQWLTHVMDSLCISRAHLIGLSLGGWLALMMGIYAPERIHKIVSLAPASFVRLNYEFLLWSIWAALNPTQQRISTVVKFMSAPTSPVNQDIVGVMQLVFKHLIPVQPAPHRFRPSELKQLQKPTLIMIGEHEVIYACEHAIQHAKQYIPNVETRVIPEASHAVLYEQTDLVLENAMAFLSD